MELTNGILPRIEGAAVLDPSVLLRDEGGQARAADSMSRIIRRFLAESAPQAKLELNISKQAIELVVTVTKDLKYTYQLTQNRIAFRAEDALHITQLASTIKQTIAPIPELVTQVYQQDRILEFGCFVLLLLPSTKEGERTANAINFLVKHVGLLGHLASTGFPPPSRIETCFRFTNEDGYTSITVSSTFTQDILIKLDRYWDRLGQCDSILSCSDIIASDFQKHVLPVSQLAITDTDFGAIFDEKYFRTGSH